MNERQRRFCEHYAQCGNAAEAARRAGYAERTARIQGQRLLTNADIQKNLKELQERAQGERIASLEDVKEFWSSIMEDPGEKTRDRLRAGELLARSAGAFAPPSKGNRHGSEGEDVVFIVPELDSIESCTWHEHEDGTAIEWREIK